MRSADELGWIWDAVLRRPGCGRARADSNIARKNGGIYTTRALSQEDGFNDLDGVRVRLVRSHSLRFDSI
jgi:hypothetical protein